MPRQRHSIALREGYYDLQNPTRRMPSQLLALIKDGGEIKFEYSKDTNSAVSNTQYEILKSLLTELKADPIQCLVLQLDPS